MGKFAKICDKLFGIVTIIWNSLIVLTFMGAASVIIIDGNCSITEATGKMLWVIGLTIFINIMNFINRVYIRLGKKK